MCHLISSIVYYVIFLNLLTNFARQQHVGVNIDHENKTKKKRSQNIFYAKNIF